ncbi:MAG TPA: DEAD/DEAH box helicase [Pseudonocardiaceae bacterium]
MSTERGGRLLHRVLAGVPSGESPLTHSEVLPAREAVFADWPSWAPEPVVAALRSSGVKRPWSHQVEAASLVRDGSHVVIATGTASGKSLAYQLPVLTALAADPRATALYLSPTKALAADQLRSLSALGVPGLRAATFDGDTPLAERDWVRAHARWIFTNPDMLHRSILPGHARWSSWLRRLRYVVVDECHAYRGVFGSHVALLLRRLRRVAARCGTDPVFVLASATVADPAASAAALIGLPVVAVTEDGSPRGPRTVALWEPPLLDPTGTPVPSSGTSSRSTTTSGGSGGSTRSTGSTSGSGSSTSSGTSGTPRTTDTTTPGSTTNTTGTTGTAVATAPAGTGAVVAAEVRGSARRGAGSAVVGENGAPVRRSAGAEASRILADLVVEGARTIAFVRSRRGAELTALGAKRHLAEVDSELARQVAAYRAGYLPEERRELERALSSGALLGVASTNALELGMDIAGLDAVVVAGYPGTVASFWQQAGRAGRSGEGALVVFVARDDPLDTYLAHHPAALLGRPLESCVLDPTNPYVLEPQLACAAAELPIGVGEAEAVFGPAARAALDSLVEQGFLRRRPNGWFWAVASERPHPGVDIRGSGGEQIVVVESDTGRMLGTVDSGSAHTHVHPGAVYLHQGRSYVVDALELDESLALVHAEEPSWSTSAREVVDIAVRSVGTTVRHGEVRVTLGEVDVTSQVVGYLRRLPSGAVLDSVPLDLPQRTLRTKAVWYTVSEELLADAGIDPARVPGALHAAEHAAIGLLPLFAVCDRWDIGGVSTALHPDTGAATVFVHDGHPGGAGFADRGYAALRPWLAATRGAIAACECPAGCPSCVQSPKCGNGNDPLDKPAAVAVLDAVLSYLPA